MSFKRVFDRYEPDNWTTRGAKILSAESVTALRAALARGPVVLQHWLYRGASSPRVVAIEDYEEFETYLRENAVPGDAFEAWRFLECCRPELVLTQGKLEDSDGCIPSGGAY